MLDRTPQAGAARIGEPLEAALSRCKDAVALWADTEHYEEVSNDLLAALAEVTDRIEPGEPGAFHLDLTGAARLYGGPDNLHQALLAACDSHWRPRLGVAAGKFPSRCAALQAEAGGVQCLPGDRRTVRRQLAPLPVSQLPVPLEMADRLRIFGIHTFGELARQSAGALEAQFGPAGRRAWELARGVDREPVVPATPPVSVQEQLDFPFPSDSVTMLEAGLQALSQRIWQRRELHNRGVRRATVGGALAEGGIWHFERTLNTAVSDGEEMLRILQSGLAARRPDGASRYPVGELENLGAYIPDYAVGATGTTLYTCAIMVSCKQESPTAIGLPTGQEVAVPCPTPTILQQRLRRPSTARCACACIRATPRQASC